MPRNVFSIAHDEIALPFIAFHQAMAGYRQQGRIGIDCNDMTYGLSADLPPNFHPAEVRVTWGFPVHAFNCIAVNSEASKSAISHC